MSYSSLLYARPSLWSGIAHLLDFGNTLSEYNGGLTGRQLDAMLLAADRRAIIQDVRIISSRTRCAERARASA